jgi:hypothetical protein
MIRWPASCRRHNPFEAHLRQIERVDKRIDHANGITLVNEIIEALGNSVHCPRSALSMKRLIESPIENRKIITAAQRFTQPRPIAEVVDLKDGCHTFVSFPLPL